MKPIPKKASSLIEASLVNDISELIEGHSSTGRITELYSSGRVSSGAARHEHLVSIKDKKALKLQTKFEEFVSSKSDLKLPEY